MPTTKREAMNSDQIVYPVGNDGEKEAEHITSAERVPEPPTPALSYRSSSLIISN